MLMRRKECVFVTKTLKKMTAFNKRIVDDKGVCFVTKTCENDGVRQTYCSEIKK